MALKQNSVNQPELSNSVQLTKQGKQGKQGKPSKLLPCSCPWSLGASVDALVLDMMRCEGLELVLHVELTSSA